MKLANVGHRANICLILTSHSMALPHHWAQVFCQAALCKNAFTLVSSTIRSVDSVGHLAIFIFISCNATRSIELLALCHWKNAACSWKAWQQQLWGLVTCIRLVFGERLGFFVKDGSPLESLQVNPDFVYSHRESVQVNQLRGNNMLLLII